jgi:hypothetical protein
MCVILIVKPRSKSRRRDVIKMHVGEAGAEVMGWVLLTQDWASTIVRFRGL